MQQPDDARVAAKPLDGRVLAVIDSLNQYARSGDAVPPGHAAELAKQLEASRG